MQKIKVLQIITGLEAGGAERLTLSIAVRIAKMNYDSRICALYGEGALANEKKNADVKIIKLRKKHKVNPFIILDIYKIIKENKPDIIHTHLIHATLYGRIAAILAGVRIIFTTEHNTSNWKKKYFLINLLYRLTAKSNKKIFAISEAVKQSMINIGKIDSSKIEVLYNGIELAQFRNQLLNVPIKDHEYKQPVIGTVGRLDIRKGHKYLLDAAVEILKHYPEATFLIIGDGDQEKNLKQQVTSLGLSHRNIKFLGFQKNVVNYLRLMNIFVLPSLEEGLGLAILEAMAAGIPVVATAVGGITEIVKHGETGVLVEPKNSNVLAEAILQILNNPVQADSFCEQGKKLVEKKFHVDLMVKNIANFYDQYIRKLRHYI